MTLGFLVPMRYRRLVGAKPLSSVHFTIGSLCNGEGKATTTPQNIDLIGSMRKNNRAARTLVKFFGVVCEVTMSNYEI